jgi:hypothetical protein
VHQGGGEWVDGDAGPVVRPYGLTGGMTRPSGERIDLIDMVHAVRVVSSHLRLTPEQGRVLASCQVPVPLVELAAHLGLATGVVRILVSDLRERGLVMVHPARPAGVSDMTILRKVADGLRRL